MSAAICFFIAQLGIFAWAIIRIVRNSYDSTDIWRGIRYLFAGWAIVFFLAFLIISGLLPETDMLGSAYGAFLVTAFFTMLALQRLDNPPQG